MAHTDKLRSFTGGGTVVGFFTNGLLKDTRKYDHLTKGEWDRRLKEEAEWNKTEGNSTRFLNK